MPDRRTPINVERLRATFEDDGILVEMYTLYVDDMGRRLEDLKQAVGTGDANTCRHLAHAVKGSSANVGADAMWELAARLEQHDASGDPEGAQAFAEQLTTEFEAVKAFVHEFVADCA